jgi:hypothetical protein
MIFMEHPLNTMSWSWILWNGTWAHKMFSQVESPF